MKIYLDYAATTLVREEVLEAMLPFFNEKFGNPGSVNSFGMEALDAVDEARATIAKILNAKINEIIFTSSGTESINLAIKGVARANKTKGKHIVTSKIEHPAVLETCKSLEKEGFEITYLQPDKDGIINADKVKEAIRKDTILVSIMYANNEIGSINPIAEIGKICKQNKILFHTDACQAAGALGIDVNTLNVDLMTINGSKIYAPKGIAFLYIRTGTKIDPIIHGGNQEFGVRSGTENVPGIIAIAKALQLAKAEMTSENKRLTILRDQLINGILTNIPDSKLNGSKTNRLPNNVNVSIPNIEAETLLLLLDEKGISASTGSACTSKALEPSHVLTALGLKESQAKSSIRFTLGKYTTQEEIKQTLDILVKIVKGKV